MAPHTKLRDNVKATGPCHGGKRPLPPQDPPKQINHIIDTPKGMIKKKQEVGGGGAVVCQKA